MEMRLKASAKVIQKFERLQAAQFAYQAAGEYFGNIQREAWSFAKKIHPELPRAFSYDHLKQEFFWEEPREEKKPRKTKQSA